MRPFSNPEAPYEALTEILHRVRLLSALAPPELTVQQFSRYIHKSERWLRARIKGRAWEQGEIPEFERRGKKWLCTLDAYSEWLTRRGSSVL